MPIAPLRASLLAVLAFSAALLLFAIQTDTRVETVSAGPSVEPQVFQALAQNETVSIIVSLRGPPAAGGGRADLAALRSRVAATQERVLAGIPQDALQLSYRYQAVPALAGSVTAAGLEALLQRADVAEVSLDGTGVAATSRSATLIRADEVINAGVTGAGVVVAVLDTGIDTDHPDLANDILYEACYLQLQDCPPEPHPAEDNQGHGTNVAGIITSDGGFAPRGIAPGAKLAVYKVLTSSGSGQFSDWVAAMDDILVNHPEVDIVNMSLQSSNACPATAMATAVAMLRDAGVATFISAGNHGAKHILSVPACLPAGISVGATYDSDVGERSGWKVNCTDTTTAADQVACWSDSDNGLDLLAPGSVITSTGTGGGTSSFSGTSQAAPHAAGMAALVLEAFPDLTVDELENRIKAAGTPVTDDLHDSDPETNRTTPRIDARVALLTDHGDADADGCTNAEEYGAIARFGGQRNPLNPWDFYDVDGDGTVNLVDDILAVIGAAGPDTGPAYQLALDRSPSAAGSPPWQQGPPDGTIDLVNDILGAVSQFGHRCAGPP